jgi:hypothetical protein
MELSISTNGPRDSQYALELAEGLPEIVRVLNHITLGRDALSPSEAGEMIRYLATAAGRLPRLAGQIGVQLANRQPAAAAGGVLDELARAAALAMQLETALNAAAKAARRMHTGGGAG